MIKVRLEKIICDILVKGPFKKKPEWKISLRFHTPELLESLLSYIYLNRSLLTFWLEAWKKVPLPEPPRIGSATPPFPGNCLLSSLLNLVFIIATTAEKRPTKEMMVEIVMTWNNTEVYFAMALSSRYGCNHCDRWGCTFLISYPDLPWTEWDLATR